MKINFAIIFYFILSLLHIISCQELSDEELKAQKFLDKYEDYKRVKNFEANEAAWNHATNVSSYNAKIKSDKQAVVAKIFKQAGKYAEKFDMHQINNETIKRRLMKIIDIGDAALDPTDYKKLSDITNRMQSRYAKCKVPSYKQKTNMMSLEPDITNVLETSRQPHELKHYWTQWYNKAGAPNKNDFFNYVALKNKAAKLNRKFSWNVEINFTLFVGRDK
jgi:peptidyl-dipeptidase A